MIVLSMAMAVSCTGGKGDGKEGRIKISGKLERADSMKLYLVEISAQSGPGDPVDSAILGEGGSFSFEYPTEEPFLFMLYLQNDQFAYLIAHPGEELSIKADGGDMARTLKVEGGDDAILLTGLTQKYMNTMDHLESLWQEFKVAMKNKANDSIRDYYEGRYHQAIDGHAQYIRDFVSEHPDNLASLFALFQQYGDKFFLRPLVKGHEEDLKYFKMVVDGLESKYPDLKHTQAIRHYYHARLVPEVKKRQERTGLKAGQPAPSINTKGIEGKRIMLDSLRGKYVLVDFWASGNRDSRSANPRLLDAYNMNKDKGLKIIQVSMDTDLAKCKQAIETDQTGEWMHICDTKAYDSPLAIAFKVATIPDNFLVGPDGRIIGRGYKPDQLAAAIQDHMKKNKNTK